MFIELLNSIRLNLFNFCPVVFDFSLYFIILFLDIVLLSKTALDVSDVFLDSFKFALELPEFVF